MKTFKGILILLIIGVIITSCGSMRNNKTKVVNKVLEDHESSSYNFPAGVYYSYQFDSDKPAYDFDEQSLIEALVSNKIPVRNLWYKNASSSCVPPGSDMAMTVMVEAVLVVHLNKADDRLLDMNFKEIDTPAMGTCAYRVHRYVFAVQ